MHLTWALRFMNDRVHNLPTGGHLIIVQNTREQAPQQQQEYAKTLPSILDEDLPFEVSCLNVAGYFLNSEIVLCAPEIVNLCHAARKQPRLLSAS